MDNTLYNFMDAQLAACNSVVRLIGADDGMELLRYFLRSIHGFEHPENIRDYMHDRGIHDNALFSEAEDLYEDVKLSSITLFPGVENTLSLLKENNIRMAIVTDAESRQAERRLSKLGIRDYFSDVITPDISGKRKPEPDSFIMALDCLNASANDAWVVGDSLRREVEPGNRLGMTTVFAKYGDWVNTPFPSIKPDYVIDHIQELPDLMEI